MPRGDRSIATREALLGAAAKTFVRRGRYGATVRAIADEAGVTVPAIYYHFDGTDQLYDTLLREGRARFRAMAEEAALEPGDPCTRLRGLARTYTRFGRENPIVLRLICMELFGPLEPTAHDCGAAELRKWIDQQLVAVIGELLAGTRESPGLAVRLFLALMNGLLLEQARDPATSLLDDALADRAVDLFVRGIEQARSGGVSRRPPNGPERRAAAGAEERR
jgi:AcrR family transcriptional regulator